MESIVELINNVGFPIAAFVLMWYQNTQMTKSLNANTEVMNKMCEKIENISRSIE